MHVVYRAGADLYWIFRPAESRISEVDRASAERRRNRSQIYRAWAGFEVAALVSDWHGIN
jgi:hypothetical protein